MSKPKLISYYSETGQVVWNGKLESGVGNFFDVETRRAWEIHNESIPSDFQGDIFISCVSEFPHMLFHYTLEENIGKDGVRIYGYLHDCQPTREWEAHLFLATIKALDGIIVGSGWQKAKMIRELSLSEKEGEKIIPLGFPIEEKEMFSEKKRMVFVPESDNMDFILDCLILANSNDIDLGEVVLMLKNSRKKRIHEERVNDLLTSKTRVRVVDYGEYLRCLSECSVFWSADVEEGFDEAMAEAINLGAHPIAPFAGCYPELVQNSRYLFLPEDHHDCIEKIAVGLEQPSPPKIYLKDYHEFYKNLAITILDHQEV